MFKLRPTSLETVSRVNLSSQQYTTIKHSSILSLLHENNVLIGTDVVFLHTKHFNYMELAHNAFLIMPTFALAPQFTQFFLSLHGQK